AKALLAVTSPERRRQLRDRIIEEQLSVRAAEEFARPVPRGPADADRVRTRQDPHLEGVADALRERLQTRVRVKGTAERGRLEIEFFCGEDFDRITGVLLRDG